MAFSVWIVLLLVFFAGACYATVTQFHQRSHPPLGFERVFMDDWPFPNMLMCYEDEWGSDAAEWLGSSVKSFTSVPEGVTFLDWARSITQAECPPLPSWGIGLTCLFINSSMVQPRATSRDTLLNIQVGFAEQDGSDHLWLPTNVHVSMTEMSLEALCKQVNRTVFTNGYFRASAYQWATIPEDPTQSWEWSTYFVTTQLTERRQLNAYAGGLLTSESTHRLYRTTLTPSKFYTWGVQDVFDQPYPLLNVSQYTPQQLESFRQHGKDDPLLANLTASAFDRLKSDSYGMYLDLYFVQDNMVDRIVDTDPVSATDLVGTWGGMWSIICVIFSLLFTASVWGTSEPIEVLRARWWRRMFRRCYSCCVCGAAMSHHCGEVRYLSDHDVCGTEEGNGAEERDVSGVRVACVLVELPVPQFETVYHRLEERLRYFEREMRALREEMKVWEEADRSV